MRGDERGWRSCHGKMVFKSAQMLDFQIFKRSFVTCDLALDELWETQAEAQGGAKASALATERVVFLHRFHAKVSQKLTEHPHIQGAETHTGREAFGLKKKLSVGR